jgi:hypothetical protein
MRLGTATTGKAGRYVISGRATRAATWWAFLRGMGFKNFSPTVTFNKIPQTILLKPQLRTNLPFSLSFRSFTIASLKLRKMSGQITHPTIKGMQLQFGLLQTFD